MTDTIKTRHFFMQKFGLVSAFAIALVIAVASTSFLKEENVFEKLNQQNTINSFYNLVRGDLNQINQEITFLRSVESKMRDHADWKFGTHGFARMEQSIINNRFYSVMDCLVNVKLIKPVFIDGTSCKQGAYDNIIKQYNSVIDDVEKNGVSQESINRVQTIHNSINKAWQDAIKTSNLASAKMADYVLAYSDEFKPSDVQIMSLQSKSLVEAMSNVTWKNRHTQMDDLLNGITRPSDSFKSLNITGLKNQLENVNNVDYSKTGFGIFAVSLFVLVMSVFYYNRKTHSNAKKELETVENKIKEVVESFKSTFAEAEAKAKVSQDGQTVEELEAMIALAEKRSNEILAGKPSAEQAVIQAKAELDEAKHAVSEFNKTEDYRNRLAELSRLHEVLVQAEKNVTAKEQALDNARIAKEQAVDRQNRAYSMVSHEETHAAAKAEQDAEKDLELAQVAVLNAKKEHQTYGSLFYGEYNTKEKRDSFNAIIEGFDPAGLANAEQAVEKAQAIVDGYNQEIDKILTDVPMIQEKIESINKAWNLFASQEQTSLRKNSLASALAPLYEQKQKLEPLVSGLLPFTSKKKTEETEKPVNA